MLRFYRETTAGTPDELTLNAGLLHAPDGSGTKLAGIAGCHWGRPSRPESDARAAAPFGSPVDACAGPMEYAVVNSLLDPRYPKGALNYWKSSFLASSRTRRSTGWSSSSASARRR